MSKLTTLIFIFVSPTLAGIFVIGVLAVDTSLFNAMPIIIAAAVGVVVAIPISYFIAQAMKREAQRTRERIQDSGV